jgi:preprotein translocase subunit YajC
MGILIILVFFAVAWFLLIVPRKRELRRHQAVLAQMAAGDEVITASGLYGTIRSIEGEVVELEVAPAIVVRVARRAVAAMADPSADASELVDLTDEPAGELAERSEAAPTGPADPDATDTGNRSDRPDNGI